MVSSSLREYPEIPPAGRAPSNPVILLAPTRSQIRCGRIGTPLQILVMTLPCGRSSFPREGVGPKVGMLLSTYCCRPDFARGGRSTDGEL